MKYVIPSYNRLKTLETKSLTFLKKHGISPDNIYIFTAPEEFDLYSQTFSSYKVILGLKGLMEQRNFITDYFEEGEELVCLDDDIEDLKELRENKLVTVQDLESWIQSIFQDLRNRSLSFWGIYPISNAFFMKPTVSTDLKFCIGHFWGVINRKDIKISLLFKEDYQRTLLFYKRDGGVLRINNICAKTKMYSVGGIGQKQKDRLEENIKSSKYLLELYPECVRMNRRREGEIILFTKRNGKARANRPTNLNLTKSANGTEFLENTNE